MATFVMRSANIDTRSPRQRGPKVRPGKRLYMTADRTRLVPQGDPEARTLYCTETSEVPADEFDRLMNGGNHAEAES